jgi:hypothetical protein
MMPKRLLRLYYLIARGITLPNGRQIRYDS